MEAEPADIDVSIGADTLAGKYVFGGCEESQPVDKAKYNTSEPLSKRQMSYLNLF